MPYHAKKEINGAEVQVTQRAIVVLRATKKDSKDIWEWRNDELTKKMSIATDGVSWETHKGWYEKSLVNPNRYLYLGFVNDSEKIGMCRFDVEANANIAEVSINVNPIHRGKKLSSQLLARCISAFFEEQSLVLSATIKKVNIGSIKCFESNGFVLLREDGETNYYEKQAL